MNIKKLLLGLVIAIFFSTISVYGLEVNAEENSRIEYATDEEKDYQRGQLNRYFSDLKMRYDLSEEKLKQMNKIYESAMSYMANASLAVSEIASYRGTVEGYLLDIAKENTGGTEKFLMLSNEVPILSAKYSEQTFVVLSLINMGKSDITDLVITPTVSNDKTKWPFDIGQAYDAQCVQIMQASDTVEEAYEKRMDIGWYFNVRKDVLTGCYPLTFHAKYYHEGSPVEADITTYINITGSDPSKLLIDDPDKQKSNPRIIVTGYTTEPEVVYAGSTFKLSVDVKNTSDITTVKNVLFNMEATVEGKDADATYAAFLPTSGSSSVYAGDIAPGQTYNISIEMEAKSDLSQKPYVLTVNMKYDTDEEINLSDTAKVSVPIKQEAKLDTGTFEVMPETIALGEQSNIMFSVFNTGKTTLYNVKVSYESETVESGITYLGNIAPGSTGNVDSMVTGIMPDTGEPVVKTVITYEDEAGNESRVEKDINLSVYEMVMDNDIDMEIPEDIEEPAKKGLPIGIIAGIAAGIVVLIIVIVVLVKKKAKKQKEARELVDEDDE